MDSLYNHDSLFQGLRYGVIESSIFKIDHLNFPNLDWIKPDFWSPVDPTKVTLNVVYCLLSMHFSRKSVNICTNKKSPKIVAASKLGIDSNAPILKNIGIKKEKTEKDVTPYGLFISRLELTGILNACFGQTFWTRKNMVSVYNSLFNKFKKTGCSLGTEFVLSEPFVNSEFCVNFIKENLKPNNITRETPKRSSKNNVVPVKNKACEFNKKSSGKKSSSNLRPKVTVKPSKVPGNKLISIYKSTKWRMDQNILRLRSKTNDLITDKHNLMTEKDMLESEINKLTDELQFSNEKILALNGELEKYHQNLDAALVEIDDLKQDTANKLNDIDNYEVVDLDKISVPEKIDFPEIEMRQTRNTINPKIIKGLAILHNVMNVSYHKAVPILVHIGNTVFGQEWKLSKSYIESSNKRKRLLLPNSAAEPSQPPYKITKMTAPSRNFYKNIEKKFIQPQSLKASFEELKSDNTITSTLQFDHMSYNRKKGLTKCLTTAVENPESKKSTLHVRNLGISDVCDTTAQGTFNEISQALRIGAVLTSNSMEEKDIMESIKKILQPLEFIVADGASAMAPVANLIGDWKQNLKLASEMMYIHCNAHVVVALDGAIEIQLIHIEGFMDITTHVVRDFNKSFFKKSNSVILTMIRAIFLNVGQSKKMKSGPAKLNFKVL